ncbi:MAG TPA: hypothetical protein VFJ06_13335 [Halococcus sp.]|nr:hypothetical protein [Halococcus sp.]
MSTVRSGVFAFLIALAVVTSGCMGAFSLTDTDETAAPSGAATDSGATMGNEAADSRPTADKMKEQSPTNGTATDPTSASSGDHASATGSGLDTLIVERRAIQVDTGNGNRTYITLRIDTGPKIRRSPLDLSGFTVRFGNSSTYTIPDGVIIGPIPGGGVYLWTGPGTDRTLGTGADDGRKSQYVLHAGYNDSLITENTTITVRNRHGKIFARRVVTPTAGTVPFVLTRPMQSIETLAEAKNATPFALRAPTALPKGYRFDQFRITPRYDSYTLFYSRNPNNYTEDITVGAIAPQAANASDRPDDARPVTVDGQRGYYTTQNLGDGKRGYLWFVGPNGWGHFVNGPPNQKTVIHIAESIRVVENTTSN